MAGQQGQVAVVTATVDGGCLIRVVGELDLATADEACARLHAAIDATGCGAARLDLAQLRFLDACGLTALLDAVAYARARCCRLDVVNVRAQVGRIIDVTGTGRALGMAPAGRE